MFIRNSGRTKFVWLPVTTSTALSKGALLTFTSGLLVAATSSTAAADIVGVLRHAIASTDSDYATARLVEVEMPTERFTQWEYDVTTGLVAADIGIEIDLTDSLTANRGATSVKAVRTTRVLSTTKGIGFVKFMGAY
jgi:hypothetical protein